MWPTTRTLDPALMSTAAGSNAATGSPTGASGSRIVLTGHPRHRYRSGGMRPPCGTTRGRAPNGGCA